MNKRQRKKLHKKFLEDIALDISTSNLWRKAIFKLDKNQFLLINKNSMLPLPKYIEPHFRKYKLQYIVQVVEACPEPFDEGLVIFQFSPRLFPQVKRYSGNSPWIAD